MESYRVAISGHTSDMSERILDVLKTHPQANIYYLRTKGEYVEPSLTQLNHAHLIISDYSKKQRKQFNKIIRNKHLIEFNGFARNSITYALPDCVKEPDKTRFLVPPIYTTLFKIARAPLIDPEIADICFEFSDDQNIVSTILNNHKRSYEDFENLDFQ